MCEIETEKFWLKNGFVYCRVDVRGSGQSTGSCDSVWSDDQIADSS